MGCSGIVYFCEVKKFFQKIIRHFSKFKYFYVLIAFAIWIIFFDQNNLFNQLKLRTSLHNLESQKKYYRQEIQKNQQLLDRFRFDTAFMERYAREKYLLKKDDEVIYLIVPEE